MPPIARQLLEASEPDSEVLDALKRWRSKVAGAAGVPPYCVFHDRTLKEIAQCRPQNRDQLLAVQGVGAAKVEKYATALLEMLADDGRIGAKSRQRSVAPRRRPRPPDADAADGRRTLNWPPLAPAATLRPASPPSSRRNLSPQSPRRPITGRSGCLAAGFSVDQWAAIWRLPRDVILSMPAGAKEEG